ncbi:hypothetical protein Y032_0016g3125 [Ancylostoma ceylanicum]|uniref:Uncharacterized protein n=1 Tax=Ancylostoma ceylanicum TaxID=53326 RepID=A0A016V7Y6_9BILA|nr:hypothetical protein Y032_0016g3125 [Ancylostoma ceylanicum]
MLVVGNGEEPTGIGAHDGPFIWLRPRAVVRFEWFRATQLTNPVSGSRYGMMIGAVSLQFLEPKYSSNFS